MSISFNVDNKTSSNVIDCRCNILKGGKFQTKLVNSIWGNLNDKVVKLWERVNDSLPQFLLLGESTMYVSDTLTDFKTLGSYTNNSKTSTSLPIGEGKVYLSNVGSNGDTFIATCDGRFYSDESETTTYNGFNICALTKTSDKWKWLIWGKTKSFKSPSLIKNFYINGKNIIFIRSESKCYYSMDNGDTWTLFYTGNVNDLQYSNGYFVFTRNINRNVNDVFVPMGSVCIAKYNGTTIENYKEVFVGNSTGTTDITITYQIQTPMILNDNIWVIRLYSSTYGLFAVYSSSNNGASWGKTEDRVLKYSNFYSVVNNNSGYTFANMNKRDTNSSTGLCRPMYTNNGVVWYTLTDSAFLSNTNKEDKVYYSNSLDKFVYVLNSERTLSLITKRDDSNNFTYYSYTPPESNLVIVEK